MQLQASSKAVEVSSQSDRRGRPANNRRRLSSPASKQHTTHSQHFAAASRAPACPSANSALPRAVPASRRILRGGLTSAVTPGSVWSSSSCFVTAAVVSPSSYEEELVKRLLLLFMKLRRDLAWRTSNKAAWRMGQVAQGSTMDHREQNTHCKVSLIDELAGIRCLEIHARRLKKTPC